MLARGWCNNHYKRWYKTGDPLGSKPRPRKAHCKNGHPYTKENTYVYASGIRACRICRAWWSRQSYRRARANGRIKPQASNEWKAQWAREVRAGIRVPKRRPKPKITKRILDLLETEGGWLTAYEVADRLKAKPDTVKTTMLRLRRKDQVASRRLDLSDNEYRFEYRLEYRSLTQVEVDA